MRTFNICIVGSSNVGKTTFINRLVTGEFTKTYTQTDGVQSTNLLVNTSKGPFKLRFWDCSSKEHFPGMTTMYLEKCDAAIFMFDITNFNSFGNSTNSLNEFRKIVNNSPVNDFSIDYSPDNVTKPSLLCGNKVDCSTRAVPNNDIAHYIRSPIGDKKIKYYDISSKSNYNYDKPVLYLLKELARERDLILLPNMQQIPTVK